MPPHDLPSKRQTSSDGPGCADTFGACAVQDCQGALDPEKVGPVTPRKPVNSDAITLTQAAELLEVPLGAVENLRRQGLLKTLTGHPSYSRADVLDVADNPWLNGTQAAAVLGVTRTRVYQLAIAEKIPVHHTKNGRRVYRLRQLQVVARARRQRQRVGSEVRTM